MRKDRKIFYLTPFSARNVSAYFAEMFPSSQRAIGKKIFFGYIEPVTDEELVEDVAHVVNNFSVDCVVIDPLFPGMDRLAFRDICDILRKVKTAGIFCSPPHREIESMVDYVINFEMKRVKHAVARSFTLRNNSTLEEKVYRMRIETGKAIIETS